MRPAPATVAARSPLVQPAPPPGMVDLLAPGRVVVDIEDDDIERVLAQAVHRALPAAPPRQRAAALRKLVKRHQRRSTALGQGVALPHADVGRLRRPIGVLFRLLQPLDGAAPDRQPVDLVFTLLVPWPASASHHLLLDRLSRMLQRPSVLTALRQARSTDQLFQAYCLAACGPSGDLPT
jgi:mannitol/fructose-specific phosphotransferase system IIA component (Ntr-type)